MPSRKGSRKPSRPSSDGYLQRATLAQFKDGWFIGGFKPSLLPTKLFEVGFKRHLAHSEWAPHYQREATEYNLLVRGRLAIGRQVFNDGELFVVKPGQIVKPIFVSDCEVVCIKVPSDPSDKVIVDA